MPRITDWLDSTFAPKDCTPTLRSKTITFVLVPIAVSISCLAWLPILLYYKIWPAVWAEVLIVSSMIALLWFSHLTRKLFINASLCFFIGIIGNTILGITLGGWQQSGMINVWGLLVPISASIVLSWRSTVFWMAVFVLVQFVLFLFAQELRALGATPHPQLTHLAWFSNLCMVGIILVGTNLYLVTRLDSERERADALLLNILPGPIAERLKQSAHVIADEHQEVTVLFADIAGFTQLSANATPVQVVNMLNVVFSDFDDLARKHGLEKIKTIGDAYMVVGGLPSSRSDHAEAVIEMANDMLLSLQRHRTWSGEPIRMRIGINTGPVVAGVIGRQKFIYDLWGDAVNTASRMESNGIVDSIQITESTYQKVHHRYRFEPRPPIFIKGKGEMRTYLFKTRI